MFKPTLPIFPGISDGFVLLANRLTIVRASTLAALKDARTTRSDFIGFAPTSPAFS
ncbi:hypothetical protein [Burkholderia ambifaria]|uniref:hypothetical protein n=1 Tax=Burkholderia ambifaria TaxID=152480 RepID=UPI0003153807|nr:hypothetical protein [Burkholderia ambifaria]